MECGKLTAKLRDAVPVCFIEDGKEVKRFKNIEIPDEIKKLPYQDFEFSVPVTGAITFKIMFEPGTLPETWPETRQRKSRTPKAADPEPMPEEPAQDAVEAISDAWRQAQEEGQPVDEIAQAAADGAEITTEIIEAEDGGHEIIITAEDDPDDELLPETMEIHYDVPGSARKALASAIGEIIGAYPSYQAAPRYCQELCANTTASLMKLVRRRPNRPRACSAWLPISGPSVVRQGWRSHLRSP